MLKRQPRSFSLPARQHGVVLMIALIVLVALTIGGIALVRSVDTTSIIAGNLAFQQSTTLSGESGIEDAIRTFIETSTPAALESDDLTKGYVASTPAAGNPANWDTYWTTTLNPNPVARPVAVKTCVDRVCTLPTDAAGNTVSYTIQRLCQTAGPAKDLPTGCASNDRKAFQTGGSLTSGARPYTTVVQYYYRVTARIVGPRNTSSYIQTIVAIGGIS